ncbi:MAG: BtpA/SgcQ family protein [Sumerlaeia bacterium]
MTTSALSFLLPDRPVLCGMIHVPALPGTSLYGGDLGTVIGRVEEEARLLAQGGCDALMIENMHDAPYLKGAVGPEIVAAMTAAGLAAREAAPSLPLGVQVLAGANCEALAVALACGAAFVRAEGFVFGHIGDEGYHDACAGELLRYRRAIGAEHIAVLADIKKKHSSHAVTADVDLAETIHAAEFFRADGVIVTGTATGSPARPGDLERAAAATRLPVAIGSGVTPENVAEYAVADLLIVGSYFKDRGQWEGAIDAARLAALAGAVRSVRKRPRLPR